MKVAGCLHVTKETAVLIRTIIAAGAEVSWSGCNPLSTNDEVAAALAADGVSIYAWHGLSIEEFYWCIERTLDFKPTLTLDDGADLIFTVHNKHKELVKDIIGGTEETTTGVHRLRAMADDGKLLYPVFAVNDSETKWDFDNVYGTGQSSLDGVLRATSVLIAGKTVVTGGYRPLRPRRRRARARPRRQRDRDRDQGDPGAQGDPRGPPRDADGRGRASTATSSSPRPA